jgi:pyruvate/2-oxoglutarate dehydrogenase complex dihydrolipoamide dehydrogenase (E3) component
LISWLSELAIFGVDVHLGTEAIGIEKSSAQLIVRGLASGKTSAFQTEMVVHAAGRVPEIHDLNLDAAGIEWEKRGVRVNEFCAKCVDFRCVCGGRCRQRPTAGSGGKL